jgi:hypothetical protein
MATGLDSRQVEREGSERLGNGTLKQVSFSNCLLLFPVPQLTSIETSLTSQLVVPTLLSLAPLLRQSDLSLAMYHSLTIHISLPLNLSFVDVNFEMLGTAHQKIKRIHTYIPTKHH